MNNHFREISYQEIKDLSYVIDDDRYGIASYYTEVRRKAFLANPNLKDYSQCALYLAYADDVVVGRLMPFTTKVKLGNKIFEALTGSALEVEETYKKYVFGIDLMLWQLRNNDYDFVIASGISKEALPIYKKLRYSIIEFPRLIFLANSNSIIESKGIHGKTAKLLSFFINSSLKIFRWINNGISKRLSSKYTVKKEITVPEWVNDIVLNDCHKYMEIHDKKWLQWNLNNNFKGHKRDIQSFYSVCYENKPVAFFMTKERYKDNLGVKIKNILVGSIVEWGCVKDHIITEGELYKIAFSTFSKDVDIIDVATNDVMTIKTMKKFGFIKKGFAHIVFKNKMKMFNEISDSSLWRIRYGYADTILT